MPSLLSFSPTNCTTQPEKEEAEARAKTRQQELKSRPEIKEKVFSLKLKLAVLQGLPQPETKTNAVAKAETAEHATKDTDEDEAGTDVKVPPVDSGLKEAKRILTDFIGLSRNTTAVAANEKKALEVGAGRN